MACGEADRTFVLTAPPTSLCYFAGEMCSIRADSLSRAAAGLHCQARSVQRIKSQPYEGSPPNVIQL